MAKKPKKVTIWDGAIEYEQPEHAPKTKALLAAIETRLAKFGHHKDALLAILRAAYDRGLKSAPLDPDGKKPMPFDGDTAWRYLDRLASHLLHQEHIKSDTTSPAARAARLRKIAKVLGQANGMIAAAMQSDVGNDLFSAWCEANVTYEDRDWTGPQTLVRFEDEFDKVVAGLAALETAAHCAAGDLSVKQGRPKGVSVLPWDFIETLAIIYRDNTRLRPGLGDGPFARFVWRFLTALDRGNIKYESLVDAIKTRKLESSRLDE